MDTDVIKAKLVSLQRCMERIRQKAPATAQQLEEDFDLQDIIILNLQRAVQISTDIATNILADSPAVPSSMAEAFLLLHRQGALSENVARRLAKSVGLRNIAVHEYTSLDWNVVNAVPHTHIEDFAEFGREISAWVRSRA